MRKLVSAGKRNLAKQPTASLIRWGIGGLLLLGFALRTYRLGRQELAFDEVASFFIANRGPIELLTYVRGAIREHPPLYYALLSLWMSFAGRSEFAIRFLSVIIGIVTVAMAYRLLKRTTGQSLALLSTLLLTVSPFHIRISRDARMYGLLTVWTLLSIYAFVRLLEHERRRPSLSLQPLGHLYADIKRGLSSEGDAWVTWGLFWLVTGLGMFTHYFMAFILLAEDLYLLLRWRQHKRLVVPWLAVHTVMVGIVVLWAVLSPGLWATLISLWNRGAASTVRWQALTRALNGLYLGVTLSPNWYHLGLCLLMTGLGLLPLRRRETSLSGGLGRDNLLRILLLGVPIIAVLTLPETVSGRYLTPALPASILAMAVGLKELFVLMKNRLQGVARGDRRVAVACFVPLVLLGGLLYVDIQAYANVYTPSGGSFRARIDYLNDHAQPDDGLLLHGPWQQLLLSYYDIDSLDSYTVPLRNLQVDTRSVAPTLNQIFKAHERLWVSYDSVEPVDPGWIVSRWLHKRAHQIVTRRGVTLYYRSPTRDLPAQLRSESTESTDSKRQEHHTQIFIPSVMRAGDGYEHVTQPNISFGEQLQLRGMALSNMELVSGEAVLILTQWRALQDIPPGLMMRVEMVDPDGRVWEDHQFEIGPARIGSHYVNQGDTFIERRGLLVQIGTPPGDYNLRLWVISPEGEDWLPEGGEPFKVTSVRVQHHAPPAELIEALPGHNQLHAEFEGALSLVGYAPWGHNFTQGNPLLFDIYWQALSTPDEDYELEIEVIEGRGSVLTKKRVQPVARWCPTSSWMAEDVLKGHYAVPLPADAEPGPYQIRLSVIRPDGSLSSVEGMHKRQILDGWTRREMLSGTGVVLFGGKIEPRPRVYRAPAMDYQVDVLLSNSEGQQKLRLLGYDMALTSVEPGEQLELILYWKTISRMEQIYAVFNHLIAPDGTLRAQQDGWPQQGTYPTNLWLPGEVVEDPYTIQVPLDTPPGEYTLRVGMYNAATKDRLVVAVDDEEVPERYAELTTITVAR